MRSSKLCLNSLAPLALLCVIAACSSASNNSRTLRFKDAVTVTTMDGHEQNVKAGESIPAPNDPVQIESPGQMSLLIIPGGSGSGVSDIKLRKMDTWSGPDFNREVNLRLNKVLEKVVSIQRSLGAHQGGEALHGVEELQSAYPELTYLDFLKASAYVLQGDRQKAREAVENALTSFPENPAGRSLLNSLTNGKSDNR